MVEMLEYQYVSNWEPSFVVFTYEKPLAWQESILREVWPKSLFHTEYAANDGGSSAFTCPAGRLHFWVVCSIPLYLEGPLRVIDLWNDAASFIGYECGDEVANWDKTPCSCRLVLPSLEVRGREAGFIELKNGARISTLCPLDSTSMEGLRAIRILVQENDVAKVQFVRRHKGVARLERIRQILLDYGFNEVFFEEHKSIATMRFERCKFRTVVDERNKK